MNRGGSESLREQNTSALTPSFAEATAGRPALSPRRGGIVAGRRVSRWFQWMGGSWEEAITGNVNIAG